MSDTEITWRAKNLISSGLPIISNARSSCDSLAANQTGSLGLPGAVGFITLFGGALLNGVVMVESINQRVAAGLALNDAVFDGAVSRWRPVLMTALTSALGLIPMLLSTGVGAEIQKPLASVIVGGLLSATFLTLFVLYPWFSRWRQQ